MGNPWSSGKRTFDQRAKTGMIDGSGDLGHAMKNEGIGIGLVHLEINNGTAVQKEISNGSQNIGK